MTRSICWWSKACEDCRSCYSINQIKSSGKSNRNRTFVYPCGLFAIYRITFLALFQSDWYHTGYNNDAALMTWPIKLTRRTSFASSCFEIELQWTVFDRLLSMQFAIRLLLQSDALQLRQQTDESVGYNDNFVPLCIERSYNDSSTELTLNYSRKLK